MPVNLFKSSIKFCFNVGRVYLDCVDPTSMLYQNQLRNQNKKICLFTGSQQRTTAKKTEDVSGNEDQVTELDSEFVS